MSYPGHLRSLHLSGRRTSISDHVDGDDSRQSPLTYKRKHTGSSSNDRDAGSLDPSSVYFSPGEIADTVYDDRGNEARPSLWIGNVSKGISEKEVKAIFGLGDWQAKIQSMRIQPSGRECYIFVNYWNVEDATQALSKYHECDIFESGRPIYIRFAKSQEEAVKEKMATNRTASKPETRKKDPLPPTGPRAMISPPPLKRSGSSYRPSEHSVLDVSARSLKRKRGRGQSTYENCYRPTYRGDEKSELRGFQQGSRRSSNARDEYESLQFPMNPSLDRTQSYDNRQVRSTTESNRTDDHHQDQQQQTTTENRREEYRRSGAHPERQSPTIDHSHIDLDDMQLSSVTTSRLRGERVDLDGMQFPVEGNGERSQSDGQDAGQKKADTISTNQQPFDHLVRLFETQGRLERSKVQEQALRIGQGPSATVAEGNATDSVFNVHLDRIRHATEETDTTMSSNKSTIRKQTCAKCDKPETTLSTLSQKCSRCPRKFHSACGNASGSIAEDATFVCSRCLRKGKVGPKCIDSAAPSMISEPLSTSTNSLELQQKSLDMSKFQLEHDATTNTTQPLFRPSMETLHLDTSFTEPHSGDVPLKSTDHLSPPHAFTAKDITLQDRIVPNMYVETNSAASQKIFESAKSMVEKYKSLVTCAHWEKGSCRRSNERECMFAHTYTIYGSPRSQRSAKDWTCCRWKVQGVCHEMNCIHAHYDTGLYIGFDGWASKKHLTCPFYYNRGHCRKSEVECPYAHQDTGFLAPEPNGSISKGVGESKVVVTNEILAQCAAVLSQFPRQIETSLFSGQPYAALLANGLRSPFSTVQSDSSYSPVDMTENPTMVDTVPSGEKLHQQPRTNASSYFTTKDLISETHEQSHSGEREQQAPGTENLAQIQMSRDPRKPKPSVLDTQPNSTYDQTLSNSEITSSSDHTTAGKAMEPFKSASKQFSMRECVSCGKKVLKSDICVSCKESNSTSTHPSPIKTAGLGMIEPLDQVDKGLEISKRAQQHTDVHLDSLISDEFERPLSKDVSTTRVLKRAASGSNMFLPNKRARPSLTTIQNGSITEVRLDGTKLVTDQPSIGTLIEQAKVTKIVAGAPASDIDRTLQADLVSKVPDTTAPSDPVLAKSAQIETPLPLEQESAELLPGISSPNEQAIPDDLSPQPVTVERSDSQHEPNRPDEWLGTGGKYIVSDSPSPLSTAEQARPYAWHIEEDKVFEDLLQEEREKQSAKEQEEQDGELTLGEERRRKEQQYEEELGREEKVLETLKSRRRSVSSNGNSDVPLAMLDTRKSRREEASPVKKSCTCSTRRRKCLHSSDFPNKHDPQKCYEWILAEKARGSEFKGRSRIELESIQDAARRYTADVPFSTVDDLREYEDADSRMPTTLTEGTSTDKTQQRAEKPSKGPSTSTSADSVFDVPLALTDDDTADTSYDSPPVTDDLPKIKDDPLLEQLKRQSVEFESSDEEGDVEEIPEFVSDRQKCTYFRLPFVSKGQGLKDSRLLYERQMIRNQYIHNNPHYEVDRSDQKHMIRAKVQRKVSHQNASRDRFLPDSIVIRDEDMSLQEFLGIPQHVVIEPCLFGQGATETLAFREREKEQEYGNFDFTGFRNKRRVNDVQKWPLTER